MSYVDLFKQLRQQFSSPKCDDPAGCANSKENQTLKGALDESDPQRKSQVLPQFATMVTQIMQIMGTIGMGSGGGGGGGGGSGGSGSGSNSGSGSGSANDSSNDSNSQPLPLSSMAIADMSLGVCGGMEIEAGKRGTVLILNQFGNVSVVDSNNSSNGLAQDYLLVFNNAFANLQNDANTTLINFQNQLIGRIVAEQELINETLLDLEAQITPQVGNTGLENQIADEKLQIVNAVTQEVINGINVGQIVPPAPNSFIFNIPPLPVMNLLPKEVGSNSVYLIQPFSNGYTPYNNDAFGTPLYDQLSNTYLGELFSMPTPIVDSIGDSYYCKFYANTNNPHPGWAEFHGLVDEDIIYTLANNSTIFENSDDAIRYDIQTNFATDIDPYMAAANLTSESLTFVLDEVLRKYITFSHNTLFGNNGQQNIQNMLPVLQNMVQTAQSDHLPNSVLNQGLIQQLLQQHKDDCSKGRKCSQLAKQALQPGEDGGGGGGGGGSGGGGGGE